MKTQNQRISTRLTDQERQTIEQLIANNQYKSLSDFLRVAIEKLLRSQEVRA